MLRLEQTGFHRDGFSLNADLSLEQGQRMAVLGASGSGKSTLLSLIAGFERPDHGRIILDGQDVTARPVADRPLSILFQDGNLFPHLSVADNIALGIAPNLRLTEPDRERVADSMAKVGLDGLGDRKPADLSGGQQSRVALARMLLRRHPLALLDEPFAALDPGLRREMMGLIQTLCDETGLTLLLVTHDLRDAERLCDRLIVLDHGAVVANGATDRLLQDPPTALLPWV